MKTIEEVLQDFLNYARSVKPDGNWAPHSPLSDLVISIPVQETWKLWIVADYVRRIQTFRGFQSLLQDGTLLSNLASALGITSTEVSQLVSSDLDNLAVDWGFSRKTAQAAYGTVRVYFSEHGTYSIPAGTSFMTSNGVIFATLHDVVNWNTETLDGKPAIDVTVRCTTTGTVGNVGPRRITTSVDTIPDSTGVTNPYGMTGGTDEEDNSDFVSRIVDWLTSTSTGSTTWLQSLVFQLEQVKQAKVITCREADNEKFSRGYGADIWVVVSEEPVLTTESLNSNESTHYALQQPVIENLSLSTLPSGWTFSRNYPVNYLTGEKNVYALSVFGSDIFTGTPGVSPTISYYYDRAIERIQTVISKPDYWFLGGESLVIVRKAIPRRVNILNVDIWLSNGYEASDVEPVILNDLNVFFAGGTTQEGRRYQMFEIGQPVDHSDILEVILEVEGVDRVNIDTFSVELESTSYDSPSSVDPLPLKFFEYPVLGSVNLTFRVS